MSEIPQNFVDATGDILAKLEFRIEQYFQSFTLKRNADIYDNIIEVENPFLKIINGIARLPNKKAGFYDVPFKRQAKIETTISLQGLPFDEVLVHIDYPPVLFGEGNLLPKLVYTIEAPNPYPGNFALVWEPLVNERIIPKFHPYTSKDTKEKDLIGYYKEGIVDLLCDILNRGDYKQVETIQKFVNKIATGDYGKIFKYQKSFKVPPNFIKTPIYGEYDSENNTHKISFETFAYGDPSNWINTAEAILDVLYPISSIIGMFDGDGEFIDGAGPIEIENVKRDKRHISEKDKLRDRDWDPFTAKSNVRRDEFGFIISEGDETAGYGSRDISTARKSLWELEKQMDQKRQEEALLAGPANENIIMYADSDEFFKENQMKRFTIKGVYSHLSFTEKANIEVVKSCKPPFVLKFARDKIKLKRQLTNKKAIQLLFDVYNLGYLVPI